MNHPIVKLKMISHSDLSSLFRRKEKGKGEVEKKSSQEEKNQILESDNNNQTVPEWNPVNEPSSLSIDDQEQMNLDI